MILKRRTTATAAVEILKVNGLKGQRSAVREESAAPAGPVMLMTTHYPPCGEADRKRKVQF
jgi:hypothetical protein